MFDYGNVYEHILSSVVADHEAKPLPGIEPLDGALDLHGGCRIGAPVAVGRRARRRSRRRTRCRAATRIDRKNRRDLAALLPLPDLHSQLGFRFDSFASGRLQRGDVEKRVAGAVGQLNEPEPLVRSEPLDDGINGWAAWSRILSRRSLVWPLRPLLARSRRHVEVIVKPAASRTPVSSFSHSSSPFVEAVCNSQVSIRPGRPSPQGPQGLSRYPVDMCRCKLGRGVTRPERRMTYAHESGVVVPFRARPARTPPTPLL